LGDLDAVMRNVTEHLRLPAAPFVTSRGAFYLPRIMPYSGTRRFGALALPAVFWPRRGFDPLLIFFHVEGNVPIRRNAIVASLAPYTLTDLGSLIDGSARDTDS
jgi:hypothetical protein